MVRPERHCLSISCDRRSPEYSFAGFFYAPEVKTIDEKKEKPGYYAILPAAIRYDKRVTALGRLLYAELTALANRDGYAWASNKYFADLYDVTPRWITEIISQLKKLGHIRCEYTRDSHRHIFIADIAGGGVEENFQGGAKKTSRAVEENFDHNNTSNTLTRKIKQKRPREDRDYQLKVLTAAMAFNQKVHKILTHTFPFTYGENATFTYYRLYLSKRGPEWLYKAAKKLMAAKRYADHEGLDVDYIKKSFSSWMVRTAGYVPVSKRKRK